MKARWHHNPFLKPLPAQGLFFHRRSVEPYDTVPKGCFCYGASYYPVDDDKPGQPSCHLVVELDMQRNLYVTECYENGRVGLSEVIERMFSIHDAYERTTVENTAFPIKANVYGVRTWFVAQQQFPSMEGAIFDHISGYKRKSRPVPKGVNITPTPRPMDYQAAARLISSEISARRLRLPENDPWSSDFLSELCQWPTVRTDARVRALCIAVASLPDMSAPARAEVGGKRSGSHWTA